MCDLNIFLLPTFTLQNCIQMRSQQSNTEKIHLHYWLMSQRPSNSSQKIRQIVSGP